MQHMIAPDDSAGCSTAAGADRNRTRPADPPERWRFLGLLSVVQLLGMSVWFTASAIAPLLQDLWSLSPAEVGWLTMSVQLGFVAGTATAAILNLADLVPAPRYVAASALLAAGANGAIALLPGFEATLALRFLTGFALAGVYPPAMKMIATWFRAGRGVAIGTVVGALTVGKALPYLAGGLEGWSVQAVVLAASAGAILAALLVLAGYRDGPFSFARRPFDWGLVTVVLRHRRTRLAVVGYLGHMWELYAMWAAIAAFFFAFFDRVGLAGPTLAAAVGATAFAVIAIGGLGAVAAGVAADRWGRERVAMAAMIASGTCALALGWLWTAPAPIVVGVALIWGFTIVADSAQFSALVTECAPAHAVGTALTLQTSLGFALTAVSIWLVVEMADAFGWGVAFSALAVGPWLGVVAMVRLRRDRAKPQVVAGSAKPLSQNGN
jgi:MFS family permease